MKNIRTVNDYNKIFAFQIKYYKQTADDEDKKALENNIYKLPSIYTETREYYKGIVRGIELAIETMLEIDKTKN